MKTTQLYKELEKRANTDTAARNLLSLVDEVFKECKQLHKTIIRHMPEYTLHDEEHILRVIELMGHLIPPLTLQNLNPLELASLILSASLHDIGMAPSEEEIRRIVHKKSKRPERIRYLSFREGYPAVITRQQKLRAENRHSEADELEAYLLSEYLRQTHGERGRKFIFERYKDKFIYADFNFTSRLAEVCYSHTQNALFVEKLPCWELVRAPGEYINWRFIAVILRLADILDFDGKRTPAILFEHLGIRDKVSIREWKKHRSVRAWDVGPGRIAFSARCPDPVIEKCVRDFIQIIEQELSFSRRILGGMHDPACPDMQARYHLDLPPSVDVRDVGPEEGPDGPIYTYVDLGFHLDEESVITLVMGMNLYGNRLLFLRELLQNAVDTCRHRQAIHNATPNAPEYIPQVIVELYQENGKWFLAVEDNGMGMDEQIVCEHFARIGKSYYRSARFLQERAETGLSFQPISVFGIGVLSVFMVTDLLRVQTRKLKNIYDLDRPIDLEIHGPNGLFWFHRSDRKEHGTKLILELREDPSFLKKFPRGVKIVVEAERKKIEEEKVGREEEATLQETVKHLAPHVEFPIIVREQGIEHKVKSDWELPDLNPSWLIRQVKIDLTTQAPPGLDGLIKILLLQDYKGNLSEEIDLEGYDSESHAQVLYDRLEQRFGRIMYIEVDYSEKQEDTTESYFVKYQSKGRWSQQGFYVAQPLFVEYDSWPKRTKTLASIDYLFPVHYDLNLSGKFTVNLTTDRLRIVPDSQFGDVKKRICEVISTLFLEKLGSDEVEKSQNFFKGILNWPWDKTIGRIKIIRAFSKHLEVFLAK